jgi:DNA-binding response OmpR family regulator
MLQPSILLVEDDAFQRKAAETYLMNHDLKVIAVENGAQMRRQISRAMPDLVLLDVQLPGQEDGFALARWLRESSTRVGIIMLTAAGDSVDKVLGLESGADDYVVKPFKPKELVARVRARLRSRDDAPPETLTIGPPEDVVTIDVPGHLVMRGDEQIALTPLEFDLLVALARKPRTVFTREVLLEQVWHYRHAADTRLVNVHVQRLRAKVERDPETPQVVVTVRGVGYKAGPP